MDQNTDQERTEEATPKKRQQAAENGQIPRSRELTSFAVLVSAAVGFILMGPALTASLVELMRGSLSLEPQLIFDSRHMLVAFGEAALQALLALAPFMLLMVIVALFAPTALGGWNFSQKALIPKLSKLNPIAGLKRMFGWKALMELGKALAKFIVVASIAVLILSELQTTLLRLGSQPLLTALNETAELLAWTFLLLALPLALIAVVDVPFQLFDNARQLRMTKQEVKDEMKQTEGKPEVKGRIRQLQRELAQRRMMEKVPEADVIITKPTLFAVELQYKQDRMNAPVMIAKGVDLTAKHIRELGEQHRIPRVEAPLLARALYFNGELEQPIPADLYLAVAQVLAYVYQLRQVDPASAARRPIAMPDADLPVPPELRTE